MRGCEDVIGFRGYRLLSGPGFGDNMVYMHGPYVDITVKTFGWKDFGGVWGEVLGARIGKGFVGCLTSLG